MLRLKKIMYFTESTRPVGMDVVENSSSFENNGSNLSSEGDETVMNYGVLLLVPLIIAIAFGNVLVIVLVSIDRGLRSATNCFLTSLAVADMLVAVMVMPPSLAMIVNDYVWPFSDAVCGMWVMLDVFFSTCSILHLCMISFDRYTALAQPFTHRRKLRASFVGNATMGAQSIVGPPWTGKWKHVAKRILLVWGIALGISVPIPIMGRIDRNNLFAGGMCTINMRMFQIFGSLVAFFLPLIIMFVMYTLTVRTLNRQARVISNIMVHSGRNSPQSIRRRTSRSPSVTTAMKDVYTARQFERQKAEESNRGEYEISTSEKKAKVEGRLNEKCSKCAKQSTSTSWRKREQAMKCLQRMVTFACLEEDHRDTDDATIACIGKNNERCTCFENRESSKNDKNEAQGRVRKHSSCRGQASQSRVTSAFKNRAMASITNEQRASKVLGIIFVLFCVFWCPFFITNLTSGLCQACDQNVLGNFMNWFVWVGYVSSGVNPCVYTMFSQRFRKTFMLLVKGRTSEISNKPTNNHTSFGGMSMAARNSCTSITSTRSSRTSLSSSTQTHPVERRPLVSSQSEDNWMKNVKAAKNIKESFLESENRTQGGKGGRVGKLWRWSGEEKGQSMENIMETNESDSNEIERHNEDNRDCEENNKI